MTKKTDELNKIRNTKIIKNLKKAFENADFSKLEVGELSDLETPEFKKQLEEIRKKSKEKYKAV